MPVLTQEQRQNGWRKSAEVRKADKAELARLREWFATIEAQKTLELAKQQEASMPLDIVRVRAKLDKLDKAMDKAQTDKEWDCFSRAYERMFRVWCTLTKTPGPGNLKPSQPRSNPRRDLPDPTPIAPTPQAVVVQPAPDQAK